MSEQETSVSKLRDNESFYQDPSKSLTLLSQLITSLSLHNGGSVLLPKSNDLVAFLHRILPRLIVKFCSFYELREYANL